MSEALLYPETGPREGLETPTRWFTWAILSLFATPNSHHLVRQPTEQDAFVCPIPLTSLGMGLRRWAGGHDPRRPGPRLPARGFGLCRVSETRSGDCPAHPARRATNRNHSRKRESPTSRRDIGPVHQLRKDARIWFLAPQAPLVWQTSQLQDTETVVSVIWATNFTNEGPYGVASCFQSSWRRHGSCPTGAISFPVHGRAAVRFSQ